MPKRRANRRTTTEAPPAKGSVVGDNRPPEDDASQPLAARIKALCETVTEVMEMKEAADGNLKTIKDRLLRLQRETIPELCKELGVTALETEGYAIKVKPGIDVSIPKDQKDEAHAWLVENGHGGIVGMQIIVHFANDEGDAAARLMKHLADEEFQAELKTSVHAATLKSWGAERFQAGDQLPDELFKITPYDWADIKATKSGD